MKIYKNIGGKLAIIFLILSSFACQKQASVKMALMFPYKTGSRMAIEEKAFKEKAAQYNCEVIVTDANSDESLQRKQARELLDQGVKVLVVMSVNTYTAAEIVRDAHAVGAKVIAYDRLIANSDVDFYLSFNNYNVGKYMTNYILKLVPEGKYMILGGDKSDPNAIFVKAGQLDALQPSIQSGKIKIVLNLFLEDWDRENAYFATKEYLKLSGMDLPDVILTSYDGLGYGARQALDEAGVTKDILITGQDAEPQAIRNIVNGKATVTIYKPLKVLAGNAVDVALKLALGEKIDTTASVYNGRIRVPALLFDPLVVDKNNIKETVIKDGIVKESDIYN